MFLLGLLSLCQVTFLPGILALRAFKIRKGFLQTLVFAFALSLIINHFIVFTITTLGFNISYTFYIIFLLEIALAIKFYYRFFTDSLEDILIRIRLQITNNISSISEIFTKKDENALSKTFADVVTLTFAILAATSIWWAMKVWLSNIDTVFTQWDAIVSWNNWATNWFFGEFPGNTSRYPQLIPTNFAITYAFLQSTKIQIFAKSFMPIFNIFILLMMLDLGLETKNPGYIIGIVATRYILKKFLGVYISSGYVDVALAFFSFLPIYALIKAQNSSQYSNQVGYLWLGGIFSAGTALTKQNGLLIFAVYPLMAYFLVVRNFENFSFKKKILFIAKILIVSLALLLPWYVFNEYRIMTGANTSNVAYLLGDRHDGRTLDQRFIRAVMLLEKYAFLYPFILLVLPFFNSTFQWITLTILLPYSLIWAFAFSIFPRNLALAFPYLGLLTGMGGQKLVETGEKIISRLKLGRVRLSIICILLISIVISGGFLISDSMIIDHQTIQQKEIINKSVNRQIYNYFEEIGHFEPIMTNYPIQHLPGMEDLQIDIGNFSDYDYYKWKKEQNPEVRLMLIFEGRADTKVLKEINENIDKGYYEQIFKEAKYMLVRILIEDN